LFWKKFGQAQSANKLFNQASDHWRRRQQSLLQKDEAGAEQACLEVIRLCQLSIQSDEKMGDAYVLLSNALSVAASHTSMPSDPERYEFLQSRAAAVIHLWHSLPHRGYPITKNTAHGERLWRIIVDDLTRDKSLSEDAVIALMESYRDSLAAETILPDSFDKIKAIIVRNRGTRTEQPKEWQPLEEVSLPLETFEFLAKILRKVVQAKSSEEQVQTDRFSHIEVMVDELQDHTRIFDTGTQLLTRVQQAHHDNDLRQAIGWLAWFFILRIYSERYLPDSDMKEEEMRKHYKAAVEPLRTTINVAHKAKQCDALLLAAGLCDWVGLSKWSDQILGIVGDEIGKQAIADRLLNIKRQPRMLVEHVLVDRLV